MRNSLEYILIVAIALCLGYFVMQYGITQPVNRILDTVAAQIAKAD